MTDQNHIILETIHQHQAEIEKETEREIQTIRCNQNQSIRVIHAENIKHLAETTAQGKAKIILAEAEAYKQKQHLIADLEAKRIQASTTRLAIAKSKCPAMVKEAEANDNMQDNL